MSDQLINSPYHFDTLSSSLVIRTYEKLVLLNPLTLRSNLPINSPYHFDTQRSSLVMSINEKLSTGREVLTFLAALYL